MDILTVCWDETAYLGWLSFFFVLLDEFNWKSTADHTIFLQFSLQLTAKRIPSEAKPLLKCAKREPRMSFWLLRLLFILYLIPPPVFISLWLRRVGVGRHPMRHCVFCLFVCLFFWFGWSFLFSSLIVYCSPIVHWEEFFDRTWTNTLLFFTFCLFVCFPAWASSHVDHWEVGSRLRA